MQKAKTYCPKIKTVTYEAKANEAKNYLTKTQVAYFCKGIFAGVD